MSTLRSRGFVSLCQYATALARLLQHVPEAPATLPAHVRLIDGSTCLPKHQNISTNSLTYLLQHLNQRPRGDIKQGLEDYNAEGCNAEDYKLECSWWNLFSSLLRICYK